MSSCVAMSWLITGPRQTLDSALVARCDRQETPVDSCKAYGLLSTIFRTALADELIVRTPCRVEGAGTERAPERPTVTVREAHVLADAMPERLRLLVLLASWCGLRRGELHALRRKDVDQLHQLIRLERTADHSGGTVSFGPPKTAAGVRSIAYPSSIAADLNDHLARYVAGDADSLLFTGEKGGPLRLCVLQPAWDAARRSVGRPDLHLHDLRHASATWAAVVGATTKELMARLGHASPAAALRYQHATTDRDRVIADALAGLSQSAVVVPLEGQQNRKNARPSRPFPPSRIDSLDAGLISVALTWDNVRAGDGDRTRITSLEGWGSAIELRPRSRPRLAKSDGRVLTTFAVVVNTRPDFSENFGSGRGDLNPRPPAPKAGALPLRYSPVEIDEPGETYWTDDLIDSRPC